MSIKQDHWTTPRELAAYIGTHALGIAVAFATIPGILASLRQIGVRDMVFAAIVLHSLIALAVLALFLGARRMLTQPHYAMADIEPQPRPLSSAVPTPPPAPTQHHGGPSAAPGTILGIVAIVCGVLGLLPGFGILLSIGGLICGWIGSGQAKAAGNANGATLNKVGIILSSLTLIIAFVLLIMVGGALVSLR